MSYFIWIFLQVKTEEDDLETDFYKDLIPLTKKENQQALFSREERDSFHIPIFYSSKKTQSTTHNSAFKQAIEASHRKVIKTVPNLFILFEKLTPIPAIMQWEGERFWHQISKISNTNLNRFTLLHPISKVIEVTHAMMHIFGCTYGRVLFKFSLS